MLLAKKIDYEALDEDTILKLLDYEISFFVEDIGETKFYKRCLKALSRFIDFEVTKENELEVAESAYSLCFSKRQQRKWSKMLKARDKEVSRGTECKTVRSRLIRRSSVAALMIICLFAGRNLAVSGRLPFWNESGQIHELFNIPNGTTIVEGENEIRFNGKMKAYASYDALCQELDTKLLFPDPASSTFAAKTIWYVNDAGKEYVQIKFSGIDMRVYLEQSPFDETKIPNSAIKIGARQFYELQNKEHYIQMILFSDAQTYSFISSDENLLKNFLFHLK